MLEKISGMGILIGEDAIPVLNEFSDGEKELFIKRIERLREKPVVLSKDNIEGLLSKPKIIKKFSWKKTFSVQDMILGYNDRYRMLQGVISKKLENLVSISNCSGGSSIIGMVKEKKNGKIVLEDPTGNINLVGRIDKILLDDVIGVKGKRRGNDFFVENIIFPDIPLKNMSSAPCELSISDGIIIDGEMISMDNGYFEIMGVYVLVVDVSLENIMRKLEVSEEEAALELLKRRRLVDAPDDVLSIEPDVFILRTKEHFVKNYKGTTLIGVPNGKRIKVDLETREVEAV